MNFRDNDIIILLGAGASVEAGIPTSIQMIKDIEAQLKNEVGWKEYKKLYDYIKSAIIHGDGINGKFDENVNYNIERLANTLSELEKKEEHTIYPFIATWQMKIIELAGVDFNQISELKRKIIEQLKGKWIALENYCNANYYKKLIDFKINYNYPLRIFTLNYDLCIERTCIDARIERGFDENRRWNWRRFEENENIPIDFFLYKIHGSIDWKKNTSGLLTFSDEIGSISVNQLEIIFGTNNKLKYEDPYLFSLYEFRKYSLEAKLIITIGYSFSDDHINGIIMQAISNNPEKKILCVSPARKDEDKKYAEQKKREDVRRKLNLNEGKQIEIHLEGAKSFMENSLNIEYLKSFFPPDDDAVF
jgi:SIR2-like domain